MSDTTTRLLILGLDGATRSVLEGFISQGRMPRLAELVSRGFLCDLQSVRPPVTGPAWLSFMTGVQPGSHGVYSFTRAMPGTYRRPVIHRGMVKMPSLWTHLSRAGKRVGVVNVPVTYPPEPVNGCLVTGMLTPSRKSGFTHPPELAAELAERFGDCEMDLEWQHFGRERAAEFLEELERTTALTRDVSMEIMGRGPWDLFMSVFTGTDRLMHMLWDHVEAAASGGAGARDAGLVERIGRYIENLDTHLGVILDAAGPGADVIVMSDHGFGPLEKFFFINEWLRKEGLLSLRHGRAGLRRMLMKADVLKLRRLLPRRSPGTQVLDPLDAIDWPSTRVFFASHTEQGLHVNLRGRQPQGTVEPGAEYEELLEDVSRRLRELRDPQTGRPVVTEIVRKEEIYRGAYLEEAPDLLFSLAGFRYLADVGFPGSLFADAVAIGKGSGTHRMEGILAAAGPGFPPGRAPEAPCIIDVAPTALHLLGQPVPSEMEGRVLDPVAGGRQPARAPRAEGGESSTPQEGELDVYSEEDESALRERLRGLGYLD